jgi:hypothetical protein|tara:strand:- start:68 stop:214 length:147 start_codon:yes stop_codon:yes gene_type:complete
MPIYQSQQVLQQLLMNDVEMRDQGRGLDSKGFVFAAVKIGYDVTEQNQ